MPLVVRQGSVRICKSIRDGSVFWVGVGRRTPWADENRPPAENPNATMLDELHAYKRVDLIEFAVEDPDGPIVFKNKSYRVVPESEIYVENARWLYLVAILPFDRFPIVTFRQTGLFTDVIPTVGNENKDILLPGQVRSSKLIAYVNHPPRSRVPWGKDVLEFVLQVEGVLVSS